MVKGLGNLSLPDILPNFSGSVRYETTLEIHASSRVQLDLGQVYEVAEVEINGKSAGVRICPPYRFDLTGLTKDGFNTVSVCVVNTLAKERGRNYTDRGMSQEPSGLIGPVTLLLGAPEPILDVQKTNCPG